MKIWISLFIATLLLSASAFGQFYFERDQSVLVNGNSGQLTNAWAGGINSSQPSKIDVNGDGLKDLFLFDKSSRKIMVYINDGTNEHGYTYTAQYNDNFPDLHEWVLLRDYNCDGKRDIFTYSIGQGAIAVWKNSTPDGGELQFEPVTDAVQSDFNYPDGAFTTNIYCSSQDIPAIFDYEGDGDMDMFVFTLAGTTVEFHINLSQENSGECGLDFELGSRCYGSFAEALSNNQIDLGYECDYDVENPKSNGGRHSGSTLLAIDSDQNGKKDVVLGDITYPNMTLVQIDEASNGRDTGVTVMPTFPEGLQDTEPVDIKLFPAAFYEDVNNDGVRDLLAAPNAPQAAANSRSLWLYLNQGENDLPDFEFQRRNYLQNDMVDVGSLSMAHFQDINQDGLTDMLVSNRGYFMNSGGYVSRISYYSNTGTANSPAFTLQNNDWMNLEGADLGQAMRPAFGDLDGDGNEDMLMGNQQGMIYRFNNTAGPGEPFSFGLPEAVSDNQGNLIDVTGGYSVPELVDLDRDGLPDLVIGTRNGVLYYYHNAGTEGEAEFELVTDQLGGVDVTDVFPTSGFATPRFVDLNGEYYLFTGGVDGSIKVFQHIDGNLDGEFDVAFDDLYSIYNGRRSSAGLAYLDGDEYIDMVTGNQAGGLSYFKGNDPLLGLLTPGRENAQKLDIYPNPSRGSFTVSGWGKANQTALQLYNAHGKLLMSTVRNHREKIKIRVDKPQLAPGLYLIRAEAGERKYLGKVVVR